VIETERLLLRPFRLEDAAEVQRLCSDPRIAAGTLAIPHPYPDGAAEEWIARHPSDGSDTFAIERKEDGALVGAIGLRLEPEHRRAELGYWIGVPYWGQGYATEGTEAVLRHGFHEHDLNRVYAFHFTVNPASGRVLQKIGMSHEGVRRAHSLKDGRYLDSECYAILRSEGPR
jgi:[ribosomal protein S5]-alanine N-acetyltransferase